MTLTASMFFLLPALGELFDQRSGVLNIGLEGMILMGVLAAVATSTETGNVWLGVVAGMAAGGLMGLIHGFLSISLKVNQVVSGTGIWILGVGLTTYYGLAYVGPVKHTIAPIIGGLTPLFFVGLALVPIFWFILSKTSFGLRVRSVGENPSVAEVSGINISRTRYIGVLVGGMLSGLAGAYLILAYAPSWSISWRVPVTEGRGFIALALVFFSMWRPFLLLVGSFAFGTLWIMGWYLQTVLPGIPIHIFRMIPYLVTVAILVLISTERFRKRAGTPAALGKPYFRGE